MKPALATLLIIAALTIVRSGTTTQPPAANDARAAVVEAERAFARKTAEIGVRDGFRVALGRR